MMEQEPRDQRRQILAISKSIEESFENGSLDVTTFTFQVTQLDHLKATDSEIVVKYLRAVGQASFSKEELTQALSGYYLRMALIFDLEDAKRWIETQPQQVSNQQQPLHRASIPEIIEGVEEVKRKLKELHKNNLL